MKTVVCKTERQSNIVERLKRLSSSFWFRKFLELILTLLIVTMFSFLLMRLSPVDPAQAYASRKSPIVTEEQVQAARKTLGLDKPLLVQYGRWLWNALHGDLGISLYSGRPVVQELAESLPTTTKIIVVYALLTVSGSIVFGLFNYLARNVWIRYLLKGLYFASFAIPPFYLATVYLDLFALRLGWVNVQANSGLAKYFPPALFLALMAIGLFSQMLGKNLEFEMEQDYAFFAEARGLNESRILIVHALRHAIVKILPNLLQQLGLCFASTAIVENIFSLNGIGQSIIRSISQRDSTMLHGQLLVLALAIVFFNIMADLLRKILMRNDVIKELAQ